MRVLIVDDEPLARSALANVLAERNDVEKFDCAVNAMDAMDKLQAAPYDVLLLDIRMPELSGMELADLLKKRNVPFPSIVFVTAHNQHAIAAFERHAVDYVLKPFSNARIHDALTTANRRSETERLVRFTDLLPQLGAKTPNSARIAIKAKGRILFVDPADVTSVEAQGNYVLLQRASGSYLLRESISVVAEKLKSYGFIRIHRSMLVNTSFIEEIQPWVTGEYILRMRGGKEFTVSRTYKSNLKSIARFWLGADTFSVD
jgi:two-component system, LytTR family, response regulator